MQLDIIAMLRPEPDQSVQRANDDGETFFYC